MIIPCGAVVLLLLRKYDVSIFLFSMSHPEPVLLFLLCLLVTVSFSTSAESRHKMEASFQGGCSVKKDLWL